MVQNTVLRLMQEMALCTFLSIRIVQNYSYLILTLVFIDLLACHMACVVQARYFRSKLVVVEVIEGDRNIQDDIIVRLRKTLPNNQSVAVGILVWRAI